MNKYLEVYTSKTCPPCRAIKSFLNKITGCKILIYDFNDDEINFIDSNIQTVPTLILKDADSEKVLFEHSGFISHFTLQGKIDSF